MRAKVLGTLLTLVGCAISGCASTPQVASPPIHTILVQPFKCSDPVIAVAVQNVFIETLSRESTARIVREGPADVVVEGTVTYGGGSTSQGAVGGSVTPTFGGVFGSSTSAAGDYVSGITALATRDGAVIGSASWGQTLKGGKILPPETVALVAAERLYESLERVGLQER